jgi:hypothetical protein
MPGYKIFVEKYQSRNEGIVYALSQVVARVNFSLIPESVHFIMVMSYYILNGRISLSIVCKSEKILKDV